MKPIRYALILAIVSLFFNLNFANAASVFGKKTVYQCGKQPTFAFGGTEIAAPTPFLICAGQDAAFDGKFDKDKDEMPSVYIFKDSHEMPLMKMNDLNIFPLSFNLRPGVDELQGRIYVPSGNYVYMYGFPSFIKKYDSISVPNAAAVAVDEKNVYVVSSTWGAPGAIRKFKKLDLTKAVDSIEVPANSQHIIALPNETLVFVNEGTSGKEDSKVIFINNTDKMSVAKELTVGGMGNHLAQCEDFLYVTMNGTHKVMIIDWKKQAIVDSIAIPTTGYDGPRETLLINEAKSKDYKDFEFYTTAYDGHVYYGKGNKILETSENNNKKRQGIAYYYNLGKVVVTDISNPDYSPATSITFYDRVSSVEANNITNISVYPNPVVNEINMQIAEIENASCDVNIFDILGNVIANAKSEISNNNLKYNISSLNLAKGTYYVKVKADNKTISSKFVID